MKTEEIDVSVIVINFNTYNLTCNCLKSVFEKTLDVKYEVILVDNNSTECDPQVFKAEFPQIKLIVSPVNVGFAKGNNLGISKSAGDYVLLLNSDTELVNNAIKIAFDKINNDKTIGVLSAKCIYPNGTPQSVAGKFPSIKTELLELIRWNKVLSKQKKSALYLGDLWDYNKETTADWIWGTFFLIPKKVINLFPSGKLHDIYFMYYEDVLWCYYIKNKLNLKVVYYPDAVVIHYLSGSSVVTDAKNNFRVKMLPNESKFLLNEKGKLYASLFYFIKALHYFTLRKKDSIEDSKFYLKFLNNKIINHRY